MPDPINWSLVWPFYAAALFIGYLAGSIPTGLILTRLSGLGDIRAIGSGNIGATNVLRTGHKGLAALTLLGDALKGYAAVVGLFAFGGPDLAVTAGLGAFLGHCFPVWLKFRGGKGMATYLGVLLGLNGVAMIGAAAVWVAVAIATRYSSLSALAASALAPVFLFALGEPQFGELFVLLTVILWVRHAPNIRRLFGGTESRIGGR